MNYYRFNWKERLSNNSEDEITAYQTIDAETKEEALVKLKEEFMSRDEQMPTKWEVEEISMEDYIKEAEDSLKDWVLKFYLHTHFDMNNITAREYSRVWKDIANSREKYLSALLDAYWLRHFINIAVRFFDFTKITVAEFQSFLKKAMDAKKDDELEKLISEMPHRDKQYSQFR